MFDDSGTGYIIIVFIIINEIGNLLCFKTHNLDQTAVSLLYLLKEYWIMMLQLLLITSRCGCNLYEA